MRIYRKGRRDNVRKEAAQKKSIWSKNLVVVLIGDFLTGMGLSLVVPFLPLYVDTLGVFTKAELNFWSGAIFSITFLVTALVSPFWGRLADRYGRKLMLVRSAAGMAVFMFLTAFATDVYQLLILRALFGVFAGFIPNATALMLANTPKEQSGQILGIINTAPVSGTLIGPLIGGVMVTFLGYAQVFLIIGAIFFVLLLLSMIFVKEDFVPPEKSKTDSIKMVFSKIDSPKLIIGMFLATLGMQLMNTAINPILSLYVREIMEFGANVELLSGVAAAAPGVAAIIVAPKLGAMADQIGAQKILITGLILSTVISIPMIFVNSVWQLIVLRLILGFGNAALIPGIQSLLSRHTPVEATSRIFGFNQSAMSMGAVIGPMAGSTIAGFLDYHFVFAATVVFGLMTIANVYFATHKRPKPTPQKDTD